MVAKLWKKSWFQHSRN